ncbi:MAG: bifunctional riboflavin kinase/FAD synthetase [Chloroflexota bacterium]|nr:bifunctional riboflavin kinase/FAD synthetase [Chloroflexota bacterium]
MTESSSGNPSLSPRSSVLSPPFVARALADLPPAPSVLTIGTFDGVHRGHQRLIGLVVERARARGVRSVVLTFDPHPRAVLAPESAPPRLTTVDDEAALMAALGVDVVVVYPFTRATADTSAQDFMATVARAVQPVEVWVGDDFAFGKGRQGNLDVLRDLGAAFGYTLHVLPRIHRDDAPDGEVIGSTGIRNALLAGDVAAAARLLGRPYALHGPVIHGAGRGRQIGFPTANTQVEPGIVVPKDGIYATWVTIGDDPTRHPAMTYIGPRPQFDNGPRSVEPNLINWDGDLYDKIIAVHFICWLRGDAKFASVNDLIAQMHRDQLDTMKALQAEG